MRMTYLGPSKRAAALILRVNSVARQFWLPAGGDHQDTSDGGLRILEISGIYFAPEAADSAYQAVARFSISPGGPID